MKLKKRGFIQTFFTLLVIFICIIYSLYIKDILDWKVLSIGDLNPYGGWSALKSIISDPSYRWRGISKSIALTLGISITALLLARFFCGFICPIGALQDFFKFLGRKLGIKEKRLPKGKVLNFEILKYIVLLIVLILSILGFGNIISPYSPWLAYLNLFLGLNLGIGFIVLCSIVLLSLFYKRIFCRCFCPLGAFQSLLSVLGPSKINSNEGCNSCNYCLKNCVVDIDSPDEEEISPECVRCLECVEPKCLKGTEGYSLRFGKINIKKEQYIIVSLIIFIGIYLVFPMIGAKSVSESILDFGSLNEGTYIGTSIGFGGSIHVEAKIEEGKIVEINAVNHRETSGYFEEPFKTISRKIIKSQSLDVDAISGATATSRGFINAIKVAISQALETE